MNNFWVLIKKEMKESTRNGKWIWLPVVLMILGVSQPLTTYYMPQILEAAGNLPEGTVIDFPTPSGEEVLIGTMSQYGTIGTLLFVLATMGIIAQERQNGSLTLVMVRPVHAWQYIGSKWVAQLVILLVSLIASYVLTWYYTNLLFSSVSWKMMLSSLVVYSLWIVFIVAVTVLAGTLLKNNGGIAGVSVLFLGVISILTTLLPKYMEWSPGNIRAQASILLIEGEWVRSVWIVVGSTVGLSALCFLLAVFTFKRFESYEG
ncbi:ABC transporter permease [Halalkalibacter okhensis]|uniref:Membrane protein n=1 Tax=Halalkalibacter okhensis TaxID=333138 RepID=A0A0B0I5W6_9BACI|nr:ABC transporter permease subunit [Halalkalibacter okhensis]KHF37823.1 membrane protein [Halalkalibacter okhensis]